MTMLQKPGPSKRRVSKHTRKKATSERRKLEIRCRELTAILVKRRDNYTCQWCGRTQDQGFKIDAAHVLPKGTYPRMQFEQVNIIALCFRCHDQRWHKESRGLPWFKETYPQRWAVIQIANAVARKVDLKELLIVLSASARVGERHDEPSIIPVVMAGRLEANCAECKSSCALQPQRGAVRSAQ